MLSYRRCVADCRERELEALIGILKLKRGGFIRAGWSEKIKKSPFQIKVLQEIFRITEFPSTATRRDLSILLSIPHRSVQVWFQNTRQAKRRHRGAMTGSMVCGSSSTETENDDISLGKLIRIVEAIKLHSYWPI